MAGFGVGALSVLTDETPTTEPGQILSVARVTQPMFSRVEVGLRLHQRRSDRATENTVAGVDFQYRNSNFLGDKILPGRRLLRAQLLEPRTATTIRSALALAFPNEPWSGDFVFKEIGANFLPALGFVNRTAIRHYDGNGRAPHPLPEHVSEPARVRDRVRIRHRSARPAGIARERCLHARGLAHRRRDHGALHQFLRERARVCSSCRTTFWCPRASTSGTVSARACEPSTDARFGSTPK